MKHLWNCLLLGLCIVCTSCMMPHNQGLHSSQERELTVASFQSITVGMSQDEVAARVGTPNILSQDENGNDVWIWDKVSSETSHSESAAGIGVGAGSAIAGVGGSSGGTATSQKTLTCIVKFDANKKVKSRDIHATKF